MSAATTGALAALAALDLMTPARLHTLLAHHDPVEAHAVGDWCGEAGTGGRCDAGSCAGRGRGLARIGGAALA